MQGPEGRLLPGVDEREPGDRGRPRRARDGPKRLGMMPVEVALPDWPYGSLNTILFAEAAAVVRGADALARPRPAEDAGPRRVAEHVPAVALPLRGRLRAGRPAAPQGRRRDGAALREGRPAPRAGAARRDPDDHELHRPPGAHAAGGLRRGRRRRAATGRRTRRTRMPKFSPKRRVPHGVTLVGRLFDEGTIGRAGIALERAFGVADKRPPGF